MSASLTRARNASATRAYHGGTRCQMFQESVSSCVAISRAQRERPPRATRGGPITPFRFKLRQQGRDWVFSPVGRVFLRRRPGAQIATELIKCELLLDRERRQRKLDERKFDRSIAIVDQAALGRPIWANGLFIEAAHDSVDVLVDLEESVAPNGDHSARNEHAARLAKECIAVEPVQRLRDRHEIDGGRREV